MDYLLGKDENCKWIENVYGRTSQFCRQKISQLFSRIVILSLQLVCFYHVVCNNLCFWPIYRIL